MRAGDAREQEEKQKEGGSVVQVRVSRGGVATRVGKRRRRRNAVLVATRMRPSARVYGVEDRCREEDEPGAPGSEL